MNSAVPGAGPSWSGSPPNRHRWRTVVSLHVKPIAALITGRTGLPQIDTHSDAFVLWSDEELADRADRAGRSRTEPDGAGERDRPAALPFTRRPLCQLSYTGGD